VPNPAIPAHPGVAATAAAAAPPPPTHQPNRMIPAHPGVAMARAQAQQPAAPSVPAAPQPSPQNSQVESFFEQPAPNQEDYFASIGMPNEGHEPMAPAAPVVPTPPQQEFSDIDALLADLPTGEPPIPAPVAQQPQQQPPQAQPAQPAPPAAPQALPPDPAAQMQAAIDHLMAKDYAISEADSRRLISEPEAVLPRLAAQVHVNVVREVGRMFGQVMPALVQQHVNQQLEGQRAEMEFFGRYPKLANPAFRETVGRALQVAAATNPGVNRDVLMREGATLAAYMIRSQMQQGGMRPQQGQPQPAAPGYRPVQQPYTPVSPGAGAQVPTRPQDQNPFALLSQDTDLFAW
jgi:hypothetical protein